MKAVDTVICAVALIACVFDTTFMRGEYLINYTKVCGSQKPGVYTVIKNKKGMS